MPSEAEIREWLKDVTYRPNWEVNYAGGFVNNKYVTINASEPDVRDPSIPFQTSPLFLVPEDVSRDEFYDWILDFCIPGVEQHERYENFRINGKPHRDPHAPGMPAFATDFNHG